MPFLEVKGGPRKACRSLLFLYYARVLVQKHLASHERFCVLYPK